MPFARELFDRWQINRGTEGCGAMTPFGQTWDKLLDQAGLVSSRDQIEAERDAAKLADAGKLEIKTESLRPKQIRRVVIPFQAEEWWCEQFGFTRRTPSPSEKKRIQEHDWHPSLQFVTGCRINSPFAELLQIDRFLKDEASQTSPIVPIKERSLQLFGDEKRLDRLFYTALFRGEGRLELAMLRCEQIGEPLAWKHGPTRARDEAVVVLENAATWHTFARWNADSCIFSAVVYGCGNRFVEGIPYLCDLFEELGGERSIYYFGDLDPQGILIPLEANRRARALGLPAVSPHLPGYEALLKAGIEQPHQCEPLPREALAWLGELSDPVRDLFDRQMRLAQGSRLGISRG